MPQPSTNLLFPRIEAPFRIAIYTAAMILALATAGRAAGNATAQPRTAHKPARTPLMVMAHMQAERAPGGCWLKTVYKEAFRRLGYTLVYTHLPAKRASHMADRGMIDGELGRTGSYGRSHPDLIRVEEPHLADQFAVFALYQHPMVCWEDVHHSGLVVGVRRGIKATEDNIIRKIQADRVTVVDSDLSGLRMLARKRIDLFIGPGRTIETLLIDERLARSGIKKIGVVDNHNAHAYLHRRHAAIEPRLSRVLRQLKAEGFLNAAGIKCGLRQPQPHVSP